MSYWRLPENALDDPDEAGHLAEARDRGCSARKSKEAYGKNPQAFLADAEPGALFGLRLFRSGRPHQEGWNVLAQSKNRRVIVLLVTAGSVVRTSLVPIAPGRGCRSELVRSPPSGRGALERSTGAAVRSTSAATSSRCCGLRDPRAGRWRSPRSLGWRSARSCGSAACSGSWLGDEASASRGLSLAGSRLLPLRPRGRSDSACTDPALRRPVGG